MSKKVNYYSADKTYKVSVAKRLNKNAWFVFLLLPSMLLLLTTLFLLVISVEPDSKIINVKYSENGNADYKVYLKENGYYNQDYLESGMRYIANIIDTINTEFNYQIHADENMNFNYKYKVIGELIITDPVDKNKILYSKKYDLLKEKQQNTNSNNIVINECVSIDYDTYNDYVNSYKMDYGLSINSKLIITMDIDVNGKYKNSKEELNRNQKLQISIPMSEQTLSITKLSNDINDSNSLSTPVSAHVKNKFLFILAIIIFPPSLIGIGIAIYLYMQDRKNNIYNVTVNKILKDYDRIIVNGTVDINEHNIPNKIYPATFQEMVDASQTLNAPILYYEVIKGEKCFFVILKGDTMYKYRLSRAFLEKNRNTSVYGEEIN